MIITDNETAVDYLYYEAVARTVVRLIREKSGEPLTLGLHGDWGAGKSSTLLMIEQAFESDDRTLCVRFNGWLFEGYEDAKAVLIESIVAALVEKRATVTKVKDKAAEVLKSVNWFKVARSVGGATLTFATGLPNSDIIQGISSIAQKAIANPKDLISGEILNNILDGAAAHFKNTPEETAPQRMHVFRQDFTDLLAAADIDRLVVLIDDLDRCLPPTAIATLEAVRLFLFVPRAAFVVAADEGMIEYSVRNHFPDLPASSVTGSYARNYLEKLIQVPFRMPNLGEVETRIYVALLFFLNAGQDPTDESFQKLVAVARKALQRPWLNEGFDREAIAKALGEIPTELEEALQLASQITPMLTEGARGNPRQIKRFVNTLTLRIAIADARGFSEDLNQSFLAKLMLAERFAPEIFDAIAAQLKADGTSQIVAELEASNAPDKKASGKDDDESVIKDWPNIEWARRWANIKVPLTGVDLRPYLFVSRDRRATFSVASTAGPIETLIDKLSSSKLSVATVSAAELAALSNVDAERVFAGLTAKLEATDNLSVRPVAAEGLSTLCETRAELRAPLLAFLGRLPTAKIGGWIVTGWGASVQGGQGKDFEALLKGWSEQTINKPLASVAKVTLGTPKTGKRK